MLEAIFPLLKLQPLLPRRPEYPRHRGNRPDNLKNDARQDVCSIRCSLEDRRLFFADKDLPSKADAPKPSAAPDAFTVLESQVLNHQPGLGHGSAGNAGVATGLAAGIKPLDLKAVTTDIDTMWPLP